MGVRGWSLIALSAATVLLLPACPSQETARTTDEVGEPGAPPEPTDPTDATDDQPGEPEEGPEEEAADPFAALRDAAEHVGDGGTAGTLARGIATTGGLEGDVDADAARLWVQFSTLLQEHVYLVGLAVDTAYTSGPDSDEFTAAVDALDANAVELADLVGEAGGAEDGTAFLDAWREHVGSFLDYGLATAEGDEDGQKRAIAELDDHRERIGASFEDATDGELAAETAAQALEGHVDTLASAIDALAADDPEASDRLRDAAAHLSTGGSARTLAGGLAAALELEAELDAPAVSTYVELATLLEEHVYLTGIAVRAAYADGLESRAFRATTGTLDRNSVALADVVGSVSGTEHRDTFLELWRRHVEFVLDYARGAAAGDERLEREALDALEGYRAQTGALFEELTGGEVAADTVSGSLAGHVETVSSAIDALAARATLEG